MLQKPTPKVRGYLGQLGMIYAKGHNLFETLLLNFVLLDEHNKVVEDSRPDSKAYWEKPVCTTVENLIVQPAAIKDLYTLQSRRILLHHNESGKVDGYQLTMGDYFDPDLGMLQEPMTVWFRNRKTGAFQPKLTIRSNRFGESLTVSLALMWMKTTGILESYGG